MGGIEDFFSPSSPIDLYDGVNGVGVRPREPELTREQRRERGALISECYKRSHPNAELYKGKRNK